MLPTGYHAVHADAAFARAVRGRRIASFTNLLFRKCACARRLAVYDERSMRRRVRTTYGLREIPLDAIRATVEPNRAEQFDAEFRPAKKCRRRWQQVWLAETTGTVLPPISVVPVEDGYALRDGHHRVSVARARGAITIDAVIDGL